MSRDVNIDFPLREQRHGTEVQHLKKTSKVRKSTLLPRTSPITDRSRLTVTTLLNVAAELLDEVGVDGFNTNLLAKEAGVRVRSVYRYFPNKFAVIAALARNISDDWSQNLEPHFQRLESPKSDWRAVLRELLKSWIRMLSDRPGGIAVAKALAEAPALRTLDAEIFARSCDRLTASLVKRGIELPPGRFRTVARLFIVCSNSATDLYLRLDSPTERQELWRELTEMHIVNLERYLPD